MDIKKLSLGDRILAGTSLLLIVDLLFLPWHRIDIGILTDLSVTRTGVESPNAFWGFLALLLAAALVAHVVLRHFTHVQLPDLPVSSGRADLIGAGAAAGLLVLKLLLELDALGFGSFLGLFLAAGMVYGGYQRDRETVPAAGVPGRPETEQPSSA